MDAQSALQALNDALWNGILEPDQLAIVPKLGPAAKAYLKAHGGDSKFDGFRKIDKKGKSGKLDDVRLLKEWTAALPRHLDELARGGSAVAVAVGDGKKTVRGYALAPGAGERISFRSEVEQLARQVDLLRRQGDELQRQSEVVRRQADALAVVAAKLTAAPRADAGTAPAGANAPQAMHQAYARLDAHGRGYVPIAHVRRALGWPVERFNRCLEELRRDLALELHVGTPSDYPGEDIESSYVEPDGTLYLTMSWRR